MEKGDILSHSWDFLEPYSDDFICECCKGIMRKPMLAACCGNYFCSACIEDIYHEKRLTYSCPKCEIHDVRALLDKKIWAKILKLQVKCLNSERGCSWTGELGKGVEHLKSDEGDCNYIDIKCTRKCGTTVIKAQLSQHLEHNCPKRPTTCLYCGMVDDYAKINGEHQNKCPVLVPCPNNCMAKEVRRATLAQHLSECPEEKVECTFSFAGCTDLIVRKHLTVHLQKNMEKHLNLQTRFFLEEIKKRDDQLEQIAIEKEEQLRRLSETHKQQIKKKDMIIKDLVHKTIMELLEEKLGKVLKNLQAKYCDLELNLNRLDKLSVTLDRDKLRHTCKLHEGKQNTEIWKGKYGDKNVAIKQSSMETLSSSILPEVNALLRLKHKNIVVVYGVFIHQDPMCIVMEFLPMGNLLNYLKANPSLLVHEQILVCRQVAQGLKYLHEKLYIHRNVKAGNVLLSKSSNLHCKLTDFSGSTFVSYPEEYILVDYNYNKWSAPEVIRGTGFCLKSDVWSFGMLIWEVTTSGREPYWHLSLKQAVNHILSETVMSRPEGCPAGLYTIMLESWKPDPHIRPTFDKLVARIASTATEFEHNYSTIF